MDNLDRRVIEEERIQEDAAPAVGLHDRGNDIGFADEDEPERDENVRSSAITSQSPRHQTREAVNETDL